MSRRRGHATWIVALALVGLALAVGLAFLASRLSAQRIGLAGESPGAGASLVTRTTTTESRTTTTARRRRPAPSRPKPTVAAPPAPVAPAPVTPAPVTPTPAPVTASPAPVTRTSPTRRETERHTDSDDSSRSGQRRHDADD